VIGKWEFVIGVIVGVAKLKKSDQGRHRSYRDATIIIQNTFILAVFVKNYSVMVRP